MFKLAVSNDMLAKEEGIRSDAKMIRTLKMFNTLDRGMHGILWRNESIK